MAGLVVEPDLRPRVLVASADLSLLDRVSRLLRTRDCRVAATPRSGRLLYRALEDPFDLVVMDLDLMDLDGKQTLQILRRAKPDLPVVVLSNPPNEREARLIANEHVVHHFRKPVDLERLVGAVGRIAQHGIPHRKVEVSNGIL